MCLGTGNMPQISSIAVVMNDTFNIPKFVTGAVLAILLWMVIIGGIKRIAQIASKLVPFMAFWYLVGSFAVIFSNYENIIPSLQSIFIHVFTPTAAVGGFLGASVAAALTRGVNRGLYSNEAGQGSAPIAHASSKTENPIEEGMVSILEPFIDTIVICTITGLVILSSGVWTEKFENRFEESSMCYLDGVYGDSKQEDIKVLQDYILSCSGPLAYSGSEEVANGKILKNDITLMHNRSVSENVLYYNEDGTLLNGLVVIEDGKLETDDLNINGDSLLLGADLTSKAFSRSVFGVYGQYIVAIGLLLFAFSTAIAWSYYGDRATVHLFGEGWILYYRIIYVGAFFTAAVIDTKIVWDIATVIGPIATVPNLLAILFLRKEIKKLDQEYVVRD
jgi:AGCS family alanine or glycine:cation symporter